MAENNNINPDILDFIKQQIAEHGVSKRLLITKLTQGRFDLPLKEAKDLVDKVCGKVNGACIEISEPKTSQNLDYIDNLDKKEILKKRQKMYYNISFVLITLAPFFILGSMGLESMAIFILGTACFVLGFVMMIIGGEQKKR